MDSFAEKNVESENEGRRRSDLDRQPNPSLITRSENLNEIPERHFLPRDWTLPGGLRRPNENLFWESPWRQRPSIATTASTAPRHRIPRAFRCIPAQSGRFREGWMARMRRMQRLRQRRGKVYGANWWQQSSLGPFRPAPVIYTAGPRVSRCGTLGSPQTGPSRPHLTHEQKYSYEW
ncbi:hypothetical protein RISK_005058 [Rhodopirellula islandica]|uniref:Uncharacterized protein n=1 Tax=Rhodopirellula islandica TaxID=595434 RepID=A0A0J1B7Q6_RHOIS|nr:hypothetical protein RISK_005058 [Rhodopirellula islandica]